VEVGCGTGLLLARVAPAADAYWGLDFSERALQQVQRMSQAFPWRDRVTLLRRTADQLADLAQHRPDTVVLNSIVQYFPSVEYLLDVLRGASALVQSGGHIFVGDVRSLPLLDAYHASVQASQAPPGVTLGQLRQRIQQHLLQDGELVIDPRFFRALPGQVPQIGAVEIQYKRGTQHNELTRFRYDVTLTLGTPQPAPIALDWREWAADGLTVDAVFTTLLTQQPDVLGLRHVPNARLTDERHLLDWLQNGDPFDTLAQCRRRAAQTLSSGIDPEAFWRLADALPYDIRVIPSDGAPDGAYDVVCCRRGGPTPMSVYLASPPPDRVRPWRDLANDPLRRVFIRTFLAELRALVQHALPEYMTPAAYVVLDEFPLTANGKLDRGALPAPTVSRDTLDTKFAAPRAAVEAELARVWSDVLGLTQVGIHDNFFALGGDSILSIQIVAKARQRGLQVTPRDLFQHQTIAELATVAEAGRVPEAAGPSVGVVPLTPIQHWFFDQQLTHPHHFNQSLHLRTRGPLRADWLEQAILAVARHHDAFRLRFTPGADGWREEHADVSGATVRGVSLAGLADRAQREVVTAASEELQRSLDLAAGPVFRAAYFDAGAQGWVLLVAHHLVVDAVSWRIVLEDLETAYQQMAAGQPIELPPPSSSYQRWAEQLTLYGQTDQLLQEADYWHGRLAGRQARLPLDTPSCDEGNTVASVARVAVDLDPEQTHALLHDVHEASHARVEEALLTALTRTFTRWMGGQTLLVDLEGHGRADIFPGVDVSRTVGWFTTLFPVALELPHDADAGAALQTIKEQLRAIPHRGLGYGVLRYIRKDVDVRERLLGLPQPQVAFNYLGQFDQQLAGSQLFTLGDELKTAERCPEQRRSHLLSINAAIVGGSLHVEWEYSVACHRHDTVARLAQDHRETLEQLIAHCQSQEAAGYAPSDFPAARLSTEELAKLMKQLK
jgi:non-ribosomal peptide synthase protein (TIGR01720 family)